MVLKGGSGLRLRGIFLLEIIRKGMDW